jgi:hypothetical protein
VLGNGWQSLEYLVWHFFVCLVGRGRVAAVPPRRRADHALAYPVLTGEQRDCGTNLVSAWARRRKADRYLADAMLENLAALDDFDPRYFRIAQHLVHDDLILEKSKAVFRAVPDGRIHTVAYFQDKLSPEEVASVLCAVFEGKRTDRHLLAQAAALVRLVLGGPQRLAVLGELGQTLPFVWNFLSAENERTGTCEVKMAFLANLMALVSPVAGEQSEHWRQFATEVIAPWKEITELRLKVRFPEEALDSEHFGRVAALMAGG